MLLTRTQLPTQVHQLHTLISRSFCFLLRNQKCTCTNTTLPTLVQKRTRFRGPTWIDGGSSAASSSYTQLPTTKPRSTNTLSPFDDGDDDDDGRASLLTFWMLARGDRARERGRPRVLITFTKISGSSKTTHKYTRGGFFPPFLLICFQTVRLYECFLVSLSLPKKQKRTTIDDAPPCQRAPKEKQTIKDSHETNERTT